MNTFESLSIDPRCLTILGAQRITQPTPIQVKAIPIAADGRDLVAIAQTGTGKTLAFGLPALARIAGAPRGHTQMLVLLPTRELAHQVHAVLEPLAKAMGLSSAAVYGGVGMERQANALRAGAAVVVATPGRLIDHIDRGNVRFSRVSVLVLDEADRMLDMGFLPPIRRILTALPANRQTMMFSATFPDEIARLTAPMQRDPIRVQACATIKPADAVTQVLYTVAKANKVELLSKILKQPEATSTLIFMRTKHTTDRLCRELVERGFDAEAIHGGHAQNRRQRAIDGFRAGRHNVLVATDIAARGLDINGITHVVNYDIPDTPEAYIHRIGRTARAGASGDAITFVSPGDELLLRDIERALGRPIKRMPWQEPAVIARPATPPARPATQPTRQARPAARAAAQPSRPAKQAARPAAQPARSAKPTARPGQTPSKRRSVVYNGPSRSSRSDRG